MLFINNSFNYISETAFRYSLEGFYESTRVISKYIIPHLFNEVLYIYIIHFELKLFINFVYVSHVQLLIKCSNIQVLKTLGQNEKQNPLRILLHTTYRQI